MNVKRKSIEFKEASSPISEKVTKFGGQPVWLEGAQWPLSRTTGKPMRFIGQIAIDAELFGVGPAKMAYIFMTDEDEYVDGTWEPDGGENAVILQPGHTMIPSQALSTGPTLYRMIQKPGLDRLVQESCEFGVTLASGEDPCLASDDETIKWGEPEIRAYFTKLSGNKLGGTPMFIQRAEFPSPGKWHLLLQLESGRVPFSINFGDMGVGFAFMSEDGKQGAFLYQC